MSTIPSYQEVRTLWKNHRVLFLPKDWMKVHTWKTTTFQRTMGGCSKTPQIPLEKVSGKAKLNFEEFATVLVQVKACINSCPVTPISEASDTPEDLRPHHSLIGRPIIKLLDESDHLNVVVESLRRWPLYQNFVWHLSKPWSQEYMNILSTFSKWHTTSKDYKIDDIVFLRKEFTVLNGWPLAYTGKLLSCKKVARQKLPV